MSTEPPHISIMSNRNSYVFMEVNNITLHYLVATFLGQAYFFFLSSTVVCSDAFY